MNDVSLVDDLPLIEALNLFPLVGGVTDRVESASAFCAIDMERNSVKVETTNGQPRLFAQLAFLSGWRRLVGLRYQGLRVPLNVAARYTLLSIVADAIQEQVFGVHADT